MEFKVVVDPKASTREQFPVVRINDGDGQTISNLDVQSTAFGFRKLPSKIAADFLLVGGVIYALDKLVTRSAASDGWTRNLPVEIPVSDPGIWSTVAEDLNACISFLTGDHWRFTFSQNRRQLFGGSSLGATAWGAAKPEAISLFSGGMDSLCGIIDWLEDHPGKGLLLAAHHDGQMHGPFSDQKNMLPMIRQAYPNRIQATLVRVGNSDTSPEITLRSRSIVFIAVAVAVASGHGFEGTLLLPENGTIALNIPLSPSRRGSCSTRTAHPFYVAGLQEILSKLGLALTIHNPLMGKTKGEVAASCLNQSLFKATVFASVSCAKRGHVVTWINRNANGCGMCMPCVYRRAALHKAGLDTEVYGRDICKGQVDFADPSKSGPGDLRACMSFLRRNPSPFEIQKLLLANGSLEISDMNANADLIVRAFAEIRELFRAKATREIKRMAGII
jgi:7-cyano-7-deazaguanine synthase in queuosine biosynthesis